MERSAYLLSALLVVALTLTGCDFIGDVIEFSLWTLLIIVVAVALIVFALGKAFFD